MSDARGFPSGASEKSICESGRAASRFSPRRCFSVRGVVKSTLAGIRLLAEMIYKIVVLRKAVLRSSCVSQAHSAVDQELAADRECRLVRGEEDDCFGDLAGIPEASGRDLPLDCSGHSFQVL